MQVAALALHRGGESGVEQTAERWRALLRGLTPEWPDDEPWRLVVEDLEAPAFMQPPVSEGVLTGFRNEVFTPDDLDVLVTSKNHGVKQGQAGDAAAAAWVAALVSLQTTGGFGGAGNYGIARMNGGFATRPGIGLVPEGGIGARWRRDVTLLLRNRQWFLDRLPDLCPEDGRALLWCLSWDGRTALGVDELDPWFIEVCRRIRLIRNSDDTLAARTTTTSTARIAAAAFKGNVADPWTPINRDKDSAAYNSLPTYAVMSEVLFDRAKWVRPLLLDWHEGIDDRPMAARFEVFVRGQGKTEGFHEREVPMRREHRGLLVVPAESERVAKLARTMVENVRTLLGGKVLRTAVLSLIQGGPDEVKFGDRTATAWAEKLLADADDEVDRQFFEHLFAMADNEAAGATAWLGFLRQLASETFEHAVATAPLAGARRPRAVAMAERILWGAFARHFPGAARVAEEATDA